MAEKKTPKKKKKVVKMETEKIVVKSEDELVDIIKGIESSKANKVILTFTDPSDLLISPINLKVILETADEEKKILVAQIVQNPVGLRNAKAAGMAVTDATGSIMDTFWEEAEHSMKGRIDRKKNLLKRSNMGLTTEKEEEEEQPVEEEVEETVPLEERTAFQKKIEDAIERSKVGLSGGPKKIVEHGGVQIALDQDISEADSAPPVKPSLIGKDIGLMKSPPEDESEPKPVKTSSGGRNFMAFFAPVTKFFAGIPTGISAYIAKAGTKAILIRIVAPILIILILSLWLAYTTLPLVRVKMYIESKPVSLEKVFAGDIDTNSFDFEKGTIPVKREDVTKSGSDNTNATGTAKRGEKAEGVVELTYWGYVSDPGEVTIPAGTVVTTTSAPAGISFETTAAATLGDGGDITESAPIRATEVGPEYNLAAGQTFSVSGYDDTEMTAGNPSSFSGGSSEEYTVLSQGDVDKVVDSLKKDAFNAAEDDLRGKAVDGWEIIESTVKSELDGDATTDVPVGAEADIVNITVKTESTALFYKKSAIEDEIERILEQSARDQELFESSTDAALKLDANIEQKISVEEVAGDNVKIKLEASTKVKPDVDKDEILEDLKGKGWGDGLKVLDGLNFATKPTEVQFLPDYFPDGLRHFPTRQGRILITIVEEDVE